MNTIQNDTRLTWKQIEDYLKSNFGIDNKDKKIYNLWELKVYLECAFKDLKGEK